MPFDWREYLDLANFLVASSDEFTEEAGWRSAVSRAYYAAFGTCRSYAQRHLGFVPRGDPNDHVRLRDHLDRRNRGTIAQHLSRLRQWRNQCDYDDEVQGLARMVGAAVATAQQVLNRL